MTEDFVRAKRLDRHDLESKGVRVTGKRKK
jgi:hypothetical protein